MIILPLLSLEEDMLKMKDVKLYGGHCVVNNSQAGEIVYF